jgi:hypothetical protein
MPGSAHSRFRRPAGLPRGLAKVVWCWLLLAVLLPAVVLAGGAALAVESGAGWALQDQHGGRWGLVLLRQPGAGDAEGWRLRLNALSPAARLDHRRPLLLEDGLGGHWSLANRSDELVPAGAAALPNGSAQFDDAALQPVPEAFLPLQLRIPLAGAAASQPQESSATLSLEPAAVQALHDLASGSSAT